MRKFEVRITVKADLDEVRAEDHYDAVEHIRDFVQRGQASEEIEVTEILDGDRYGETKIFNECD